MTEISLVVELTVLVLAIFLGFEVISKVPTMLHTPLMSGTNFIHGIVIVGAIMVLGFADDGFTKAIIDPENEIEPISAERTTETISSPARSPLDTWNSESATRAAAPPPTPLNRATICGIAVIFTVRAPTIPMTEPIRPPTTMSSQFEIPSSASVVAIATTIPAPPTQLPFRACFGEERKRSARMKQTIETR